MSGALQEGLRRYLGAKELARLAVARVGIAGVGGLGSNCAMLLVRSGIRRFTLAAHDLVEPSNLNRQFFFPSDVGQPKVMALAAHLLRLEPALELELHYERLSAESCSKIFANCAVVVDGLDQAVDKATLCYALLAEHIFVVGASGLGGLSGAPMLKRRLGKGFICVGDFASAVDDAHPPLAPRVVQAAALQAEAVLEFIEGQEPDESSLSPEAMRLPAPCSDF